MRKMITFYCRIAYSNFFWNYWCPRRVRIGIYIENYKIKFFCHFICNFYSKCSPW